MFSYPTFEVQIERRLNPEHLGWPEPRQAETDSGLGGNRSYLDLRGLPWSEAQRVYAYEDELIARIERADDPDDEYDVIQDELFQDVEGIYGLDIGVASTVVGLSAARCVPFTSCNGGVYGGSHHEWHPLVAFYGRAEMAPLLLDCAEAASVALCNEEGGRVLVFAADIRHMRAFAHALIGRRGLFRGAPLRAPEEPQTGTASPRKAAEIPLTASDQPAGGRVRLRRTGLS